jgi:hypothetical protein
MQIFAFQRRCLKYDVGLPDTGTAFFVGFSLERIYVFGH